MVCIELFADSRIHVRSRTSEHFEINILVRGTVEGLRVEEPIRFHSPGLADMCQADGNLMFRNLRIFDSEHTPFFVKRILMTNEAWGRRRR